MKLNVTRQDKTKHPCGGFKCGSKYLGPGAGLSGSSKRQARVLVIMPALAETNWLPTARAVAAQTVTPTDVCKHTHKH